MCEDCDIQLNQLKKINPSNDPVHVGRVQQLVDALRSGEFAQATDALTRLTSYLIDIGGGEATGETHCCLGVACIIAMRNGVELRMEDHGSIRYYNEESQHLPPVVRNWFGFDSNSPAILDEYMQIQDSAEFNDAGHPFDQIADAFERTYINPTTTVEETS